jgi:secondary thiamine-phosphate synthase enzyme
METTTLTISTGATSTTVDMTRDVAEFCAEKGDGLVSIFIPHATAGVAIFETGAGSDADLLGALDDLFPPDSQRWRHEHGTPGHGRDHFLPAFVSPSITVPVRQGRMLLGTWQSIVLVDTNVDNPIRTVRLSFIAGS